MRRTSPDRSDKPDMPQTEFRRYAIYFTPPPGPLARFGATWLGWDIDTGRETPHPENIPDLPAPASELTKEPRRYGLHATMKPPFRLNCHATPDILKDALTAFCARHTPIALQSVTLTRMGRILALTPDGDTDALNLLAASVVRQFDRFRAAPDDAEITRYQTPNLNAAQMANVAQWGYPYVLDQFRWHMTLTGKRPQKQIAQIEASLTAKLNPILPRPFIIDGLSLVGEDRQGHFHLIHRALLTG